MPPTARFWRNVVLIGLAHVALISGLVRWSRQTKHASAQDIVWMSGSTGDGLAAEKKSAATPKPMSALISDPERTPDAPIQAKTEEERPVLTSMRSEIQLPVPEPSPISTPIASPTRTPKPSPIPKTKVTPRPTPKPKPKPKPTPKPSPKKTLLAKASPKRSPKVQPTPKESNDQPDVEAEKREIASTEADESEPAATKSTALPAGRDKGTATSTAGHAGGAGGESQFGWYGSMLHDRFYSEWIQPTTIASSGTKFAVLVKLRIQKDGRVSNFDIIRPSGNATLDKSVADLAKRVTEVDPPPAGLGNEDHYDVKINFELSSE